MYGPPVGWLTSKGGQFTKEAPGNVGEQLQFWSVPEIRTDERTMAEDTPSPDVKAEKSADSNGKPAKKRAAKKAVPAKARVKKAAAKPRKTEKASKDADGKPKTRKAQRPFPQITLEEALAIPLAIKTSKPFDTDDLAKACGTSRMAPKFFYLAAASRDYGLTTGSHNRP